MKTIRRLTVALPLCAGLLVPVCTMTAQDRDDRERHERQEQRYYDKQYRDYHTWNDSEQSYWNRYWEQQHRRQLAYERASERQRRAYWHWRHEQEEHH